MFHRATGPILSLVANILDCGPRKRLCGQTYTNRPRSRVFATFLLLILGACTTTEDFTTYHQAIADFRAANFTTTEIAQEYFLDLNDFERRYALDQVRRDPENQEIDFQELLQNQFDQDAIHMRIMALQTIDHYTTMLGKLASDEEQPDWQAASDSFLGSLRILHAAATDASNPPNPDSSGTPDPATKNLAGKLVADDGPVEQLLATAFRDIANQKRLDALDHAVKLAKPSIEEISNLLKQDFRTVYRQRSTTETDEIFRISQKYRKARSAGNFSSIPAIADEVELALKSRDERASALSGLGSALDGFDRSHGALVGHAGAAKGPQTLAELTAATAEYRAIAASLHQTVQDLKKAEATDSENR